MNAEESSEERILEQALALTSRAAREAYLREACGEDEALRTRVASLIEAHEAAGGFLADRGSAEEPTVPIEQSFSERPGAVIGRYRLLEKVGEGGCGVVYVAEQTEPIRRRVALKVIKLGMDTKSVIARFEAERQALAVMDHPNIAKVLDAGVTETGRPYFVMELVRGIKITDYCDQKHLSTRERLDLFIRVCHAIQHAHQKGIIHRDIKPSNILVSLHDGAPQPVVIDFGIAKATAQQRLTDKTLYTAFEQFIGTPAYMSPEQAELSRFDVDTRSDIYALGVLLYELLTGETPFHAQTLLAAGLDEMRRIIREKEPIRPSTRLTQELLAVPHSESSLRKSATGLAIPTQEEVSADSRRRLRLKEQIKLVRGDLDWIAMKCLEKDRTRRYETANGLAADINHHLNHEPVVARPPSALYRVQKFIGRNKLMVSAGAAVAMVLVLGVMASTWQAIRATRAESREIQLRQLNEAFRFESIAEDLALKDEYGDNTTALAHAIASLERGDTPARRRIALSALWKGPTRFRLPGADELKPTGAVSFSPDGKWLATGSLSNQVLLWPSNGGGPRRLPVDEGATVFAATFSPSGRWLLSSQQPNTDPGPYKLVLWNGVSGEKVRVWDIKDWAPCWFHPDESKLLAYNLVMETPYAGVAWWRIDGQELTPLGSPCPRRPGSLSQVFPPLPLTTFSPSQDLNWLVSWEGTNVYVSPLEASSLGPRIWIGSHERAIESASLDLHGDLIGSADVEETRIWSRSRPGQPLLRLPAPTKGATFDRFSRRVFTSGPDWYSHIVSYDLRGPIGSKPLTFFPWQFIPWLAQISPAHEWVAVGAGNISKREVLLYPVGGVWPFHVDLKLELPSLRANGKLARDGRRVVLNSIGKTLLIDLHSPDLTNFLVFDTREFEAIQTSEFDGVGEHLLVGTFAAGAWLVPLKKEKGEPRRLEGAPRHTSAVAFSPSGNRLAVGGGTDNPLEERYARVLDRDGRLRARPRTPGGEYVNDIEFLTETELLVAAEGGLYRWNTEFDEARTLRKGEHRKIALSEHSFVANDTQDVWFYNRATSAGRRLEGMGTNTVMALAIAPNERFVVAGYADGSLRVRHLDSDRPHYLPGAHGPIRDLWIDPRGYWIAALTSKGESMFLTYWPVPRGRPLHDRPLDEFLEVLRAQTNVRVVTDPDDPNGYRKTAAKFPGWETVPTWQEWYSEEYMKAPPWKPMLDREALESAKW